MSSYNTNKARVAVYSRIGNAQEGDVDSCQLQERYYKEFIKTHEDWEYCGFYIDYGA